MKKIISLLSAFAMIATMFTTVAMADDNNYLKWDIKSSSATSLTADLVLKTEHDLTQIQAGFKPTNLKKNGLTSVTFVKAEGGKIGCVANARSVNIAFANTDEPIKAGTHVIGTLTLNYTEGSKYKLNASGDTSYPFLAKYSATEGTIDYTNQFTNGFFDLEFPAKSETTFTPAAGGNMVNPANGQTEKTYLTDIVEFNTDETAPTIKIKDELGEIKTFDGNWYPTNLKGQGTIKALLIVRYAGETEKTFSIVKE